MKTLLWHDMLEEDKRNKVPTGRIGRENWDAANEGRRRYRKERQEAALAKAIERENARRAERCARVQVKAPNRIIDKVLRVMEPGQWYGLGSLEKAAGITHQSGGWVHQIFLGKGWAR